LCGAGSGPAEVAPKQLLAADTTLAHEVELDWPEKHHLVADQEAMMIMAYGAQERFRPSPPPFSSSPMGNKISKWNVSFLYAV
jgi:hypothetical protein